MLNKRSKVVREARECKEENSWNLSEFATDFIPFQSLIIPTWARSGGVVATKWPNSRLHCRRARHSTAAPGSLLNTKAQFSRQHWDKGFWVAWRSEELRQELIRNVGKGQREWGDPRLTQAGDTGRVLLQISCCSGVINCLQILPTVCTAASREGKWQNKMCSCN